MEQSENVRWERFVTRPMARRTWWAAAAVLFALWLGVAWALGGPSPGDRTEITETSSAIHHLEPSRAYRHPGLSNTPPGYSYVALPVAIVADHLGLPDPFGWTGVLSIAALAVAAAALAAELGLPRHSRGTLLVVGMTLAAPPTFGTFVKLFHPQDPLSVAMAIGAVIAARRGRSALAGALIGGAFLTKQLAVLAIVPLVVFPPPASRRRTMVAVAAVVVAIGLAPFLVANARGTIRAFGAAGLQKSDSTIWQHLPIGDHALYTIARVGPFLVVAGVLGWLWATGRRHLPFPALVALVTAGLAARLPFDPVLYLYYLLPAAALFVVLDVSRRQPPVTSAAWILLTTEMYFGPGTGHLATLIDVGALLVLEVAALGVAVWLATRDEPAGTPDDEVTFI